MRNLLLFLLILAYLSTLSMSTGHLAQWYALSLGGRPPKERAYHWAKCPVLMERVLR
ncbi:hypothetical protein [Thermus scotoductus]|uniref:hypothetical protein n=1 Tax=Thermus scotoductus TaxID=37636 RepID=UPI0015623467|nr:hypothetical protein [Thermus scotoductus]